MADDEVVLITGGLGGLGMALARAWLDAGAAVALAGLAAADPSSAVSAAVGHLPEQVRTRVRGYGVDVADEAALRNLVDQVERDLGPLTTVVANAGIPGGGGLETSDEVWQECWQVNVMAHVYLARAVVPRMVGRGGGCFVSVASAAGLLTNLGNAPYSVTKHAAVAFAEWLAITYGDQGLDVRLVAPMGVDTPMLRAGRGTLAGESVAALGVIEADEAARRILAGLAGRQFLILTHTEVAEYEQQRAADRDRWLGGMRRSRAVLERALGIRESLDPQTD
jgi:NAD(P)-dependent dehydrogenase (short-subunit alcohol dehydrogenase family)